MDDAATGIASAAKGNLRERFTGMVESSISGLASQPICPTKIPRGPQRNPSTAPDVNVMGSLRSTHPARQTAADSRCC